MGATGNAVLVVCRRRAALLLAVHALVFVLGGVGTGHATTISVGTPVDDTTVNGNCTLREAVIAANTDAAVDDCTAGSGADVITVPAGTYLLTIVGAGEDAAATGDLDVTADVEIQGAGAASTIIDGNLTDRVFDVDPGASGITVQVSGITVRRGAQVSHGGGIRSRGAFTLADSIITNNRATSSSAARGGGINASGVLILTRCTVADNAIEAFSMSGPVFVAGGGVATDGVATITASTIDGNTVAGGAAMGDEVNGGGIDSFGMLSVSGSVVSNNRVTTFSGVSSGGGITSSGGLLTLANCTIAGNLADFPPP